MPGILREKIKLSTNMKALAIIGVINFINSIIKPYPTYLGEEIPITGNGDKTNDK